MQKVDLERYRALLHERRKLVSALLSGTRLSARDALLLSEIDEALARIEAGSYGRCASCGTTLPERRLAVRPAARRCFFCERGDTLRGVARVSRRA